VDNPWSGSAGSIHNIRQEMKIAKQINATGVVVHLSKSAALPANVQTVLCELAKNMPSDVLETVTLWLEIHTAKPCDSTFETPEKIRSLFSAVDRSNSGLKVGLCIDSAHVFSSGTSFETYDDTLSWLQDVEKSLHGHEIMFHLNDSASTLASGKDVHAPLCGGNIWQGYHPTRGTKDFQTCGIHAILENAVAANRMVILERNPAHLEADLDLLASLHYFQ
jgi:endonuclease IV